MPDNGGCLLFGDTIELYVKYGHARRISKEEAFNVIKEVRDKGAIHSVFHERDDTSLPEIGICNCCWDCCGLLRSYNYGAGALKYDCFYSARIADSASCIGCGICEKYCPTTAARVVEKKVTIDESRCIGCGQCVHQCPESDVLKLVPNTRTVFLPILKKSEIRIHA
jgi:ferredoxin